MLLTQALKLSMENSSQPVNFALGLFSCTNIILLPKQTGNYFSDDVPYFTNSIFSPSLFTQPARSAYIVQLLPKSCSFVKIRIEFYLHDEDFHGVSIIHHFCLQ